MRSIGRLVAVILALSPAGCARKAPPAATPAKTEPAAERPAPAPKAAAVAPKQAAASAPASSPAATASRPASSPAAASAPSSAPSISGPSLTKASPLTPKLESLVRALRARKKNELFKLKEELGKQIPGFALEDGKDLPAEASVEVLEVRKDFLLLAFVRVTPKGHKACDEDGPTQEVRALFVSKDEDGAERIAFTTDFSSSETKLFEAKKPAKVVFPPIAATVPVFEVHFDYDPRCEDAQTQTGKMVELYHVGAAERVREAVPVETSSEVPGNANETRSTLAWIKAKAPATAFLVVTQVATSITYPCTGEPDNKSKECRPQHECARTTRAVEVTAQGAKVLEDEPAALRRRDPALAKLRPDRDATSKAACDRL